MHWQTGTLNESEKNQGLEPQASVLPDNNFTTVPQGSQRSPGKSSIVKILHPYMVSGIFSVLCYTITIASLIFFGKLIVLFTYHVKDNLI